MENTETTNLFNYKLLTDSTTNEQYYCISKDELVSVVSQNIMDANDRGFNLGYRSGAVSGILYTIFAIYIFKLAAGILSKKVEQLRKDTDNNNKD